MPIGNGFFVGLEADGIRNTPDAQASLDVWSGLGGEMTHIAELVLDAEVSNSFVGSGYDSDSGKVVICVRNSNVNPLLTKLIVIDVSDPYNPTLDTSVAMSGWYALDLIAYRGQYATGVYAISGSYRIQTIDYTNPGLGVISEYIFTPPNIQPIALLKGRYILANNGTSLLVLDMLNPATPVLASNKNLGYGTWFSGLASTNGDYVLTVRFINSQTSEIGLVNVSNPADPIVEDKVVVPAYFGFARGYQRTNGSFVIAGAKTTNFTGRKLESYFFNVDISDPSSIVVTKGGRFAFFHTRIDPETGILIPDIDSYLFSGDFGGVYATSCFEEDSGYYDPGNIYPDPPAKGLGSPVVYYDSRDWDGGAVLYNQGSGGNRLDLEVQDFSPDYVWGIKRVNWSSSPNGPNQLVPRWSDLGGPPCDGPLTFIAAYPQTLQDDYNATGGDNAWVDTEWIVNGQGRGTGKIGIYAPWAGFGFGGIDFLTDEWNYQEQGSYIYTDTNAAETYDVFRESSKLLVGMSLDSASRYAYLWVRSASGFHKIYEGQFYGFAEGNLDGEWQHFSEREDPCVYDGNGDLSLGRMFWSFGYHYGPITPGDPWNGIVWAGLYRGIPTDAEIATLYGTF